MTTPAAPGDSPDQSRGTHPPRLRLLSDVVLFQLKLVVDGLRDLLLSPISIAAALIGLVSGGDRPELYFQRVLKFGRRTEAWINLFGEHSGPGTADHIVEPLRSKAIDKAKASPWLNKAGTRLNRQLDGLNSAISATAAKARSAPDMPRGSGSEHGPQSDTDRPDASTPGLD